MDTPTFVYPGSDFDRARNLVAVLGSFWSRTYTSSDQVSSYAAATGQIANQTYQNLLETLAMLSRYDVPLFHTETITPITIKKSELNSAAVAGSRFDDNAGVFDYSGLQFDVTPVQTSFAFPLPAKLADVRQLFNRITYPTVALLKNIDFTIDSTRNSIVFPVNPFDNLGLVRKPIAGVENDEEIVLWGFCGQFDYEYVFRQFAYAVGLYLKTSQGYKDLTNAIINGLIEGGASAATLDLALAAISGIPVSLEPTETVEVVDRDATGLLIITDKAVYRFNTGATAKVTVGQQISAGTQLISGLEITEFFVGNKYAQLTTTNPEFVCCPPADTVLADNLWESLTTEGDDEILLDPNSEVCRRTRKAINALTLDGGFLSACFYGELVFENVDVPLEVITDHPSGYTYLKFALGGLPAEVDRFFDEIHSRGVASAQANDQPCIVRSKRRGTLAHILDRRANSVTEPEVTHLPRTINPMQFLVENVLRNNIFVVRIQISALGQNHLGLYNVRHLRQLLPPQVAMIVIFELTGGLDVVNAEDVISDTARVFTGMAPQSDTVPVTLVQDLGVTVRLVSGTCQ